MRFAHGGSIMSTEDLETWIALASRVVLAIEGVDAMAERLRERKLVLQRRISGHTETFVAKIHEAADAVCADIRRSTHEVVKQAETLGDSFTVYADQLETFPHHCGAETLLMGQAAAACSQFFDETPPPSGQTSGRKKGDVGDMALALRLPWVLWKTARTKWFQTETDVMVSSAGTDDSKVVFTVRAFRNGRHRLTHIPLAETDHARDDDIDKEATHHLDVCDPNLFAILPISKQTSAHDLETCQPQGGVSQSEVAVSLSANLDVAHREAGIPRVAVTFCGGVLAPRPARTRARVTSRTSEWPSGPRNCQLGRWIQHESRDNVCLTRRGREEPLVVLGMLQKSSAASLGFSRDYVSPTGTPAPRAGVFVLHMRTGDLIGTVPRTPHGPLGVMGEFVGTPYGTVLMCTDAPRAIHEAQPDQLPERTPPPTAPPKWEFSARSWRVEPISSTQHDVPCALKLMCNDAYVVLRRGAVLDVYEYNKVHPLDTRKVIVSSPFRRITIGPDLVPGFAAGVASGSSLMCELEFAGPFLVVQFIPAAGVNWSRVWKVDVRSWDGDLTTAVFAEVKAFTNSGWCANLQHRRIADQDEYEDACAAMNSAWYGHLGYCDPMGVMHRVCLRDSVEYPIEWVSYCMRPHPGDCCTCNGSLE